MEPTQSFEQVFTRNIRSVYRACYLRLQHKQDAEDAAQAVFLSYLARKQPFENERHERAWFLKAAHDRAVDMQRSAWHRRRSVWQEQEPAYLEESEIEAQSMLGALPPSLREVLSLYYIEELPVSEIAKILRRTQSTVRAQLTKGRKRLKLEWERENE
ncbi:MAG: RNA polymerase sigma factor [Clostridiales bacterium]|nr:RNA polymerase sigma factor [Clostridiales bacterium]